MSHLNRFWKIVILILFIGFMIQCLYDPLATYNNQIKLNKLQIELDKQKRRWDLLDITNYSIEVESWVGMGGICRAKLTVHAGKVVKVAVYNYPPFEERPADLQPVVLEIDKWDNGGCQYSSFTIPKIFNDVQSRMNSGRTIDATFDPEFGFVATYHGSSIVNRGFLNCCAADTEYSYQFYNFQRLGSDVP